MKTVALLIALCAVGADALACGCAKPRHLADVDWKKPDIVFEGTIESVATRSDAWGTTQRVTFAITKLHRGSPVGTVAVRFQHGGSSCDLEPLGFEVGQSFLISASGPHPVGGQSGTRPPDAPAGDVYSSNYCDLREPLGQPPTE